MDDPRRVLLEEYADHVEAQRVEAWAPIEEVSLGQGADGGLFAGGDGFEWMPEAYSPAQFHFDEDERLGSGAQSTMTPELRFRVLLGDGIPDVRFERTSGVPQAR